MTGASDTLSPQPRGSAAPGQAGPLLELEDLVVRFRTERGTVTAVDGVSLHVDPGEILGIVGESGCGKSVTSQAIMRLFDERHLVEYGGAVRYRGENLLKLSEGKMRGIRGNRISMVFQDPSSSINPVFTIGAQIAETIMMHQKIARAEAWKRAEDILRLTGIPSPAQRLHEYPHQISGGMKQRVMIALALACAPDLLIADEPTTALDVTIQAQILELLVELNRGQSMGIILITHDLGVVAETCTRVVVMYLGQVVEEATVDDLFARPLHPYTQGLMRSIPALDGDREQDLYVIPGTVPSLAAVPAGCRFRARCPHADAACLEPPPLVAGGPGHGVRCWHHERIAAAETGA